MKTMNPRYLSLLVVGAALASGVVWWSSASHADGELDEGPRVIPYTGELSFDGRPVNGVVNIQAILRGVHPEQGALVVALRHDGVAVRQGAFHVNFGAGEPLPEALFTSSSVEVALHVATPDAPEDGAWLGGATAEEAFRPIRPHAFAYWTASASDLHVQGDARFPSVEVGDRMTVNTDAPMSVGTLVPLRRVDTGGGVNRGVQFQQLGQASMSMKTHPASDLNLDLQGGAGFRFKHGDNVLLEVSEDGFVPYREVEVPGGSTLRLEGDVDMVRLEAEQVAVASNGTINTDLGRNNGRRFCFLTGVHTPGGKNGRERCHMQVASGRFRISAFNNHQDGGQTTCHARCIAW